MMGQHRRTESLFYYFRLEEQITSDTQWLVILDPSSVMMISNLRGARIAIVIWSRGGMRVSFASSCDRRPLARMVARLWREYARIMAR
jgi:hypothetical protein